MAKNSSYASFLEKRRHALMKSLAGRLAELRSQLQIVMRGKQGLRGPRRMRDASVCLPAQLPGGGSQTWTGRNQ